jgi:hypothetical protein
VLSFPGHRRGVLLVLKVRLPDDDGDGHRHGEGHRDEEGDEED